LLTKEVVEEIVQTIKNKIKSGDTTNIQTYDIANFEKQRSCGTPPPLKTYPITSLQEEAIKNGINAIDHSKTHLLLGAVMRFGKTFTAYQIVLQKHFKKVIVVSAVADTRESWRNDIYHKDFINDFCFVEYGTQKFSGKYLVSDKNTYCQECFYETDFISKLKYNTVIVFTTLQDLSGKLDKDTKDRTIKDRHKELFNIEWDLLIADETHFATRSNVNGKTLGYTNDPDEAISDATS
jgi:superfamily II DNA or RNA helicase